MKMKTYQQFALIAVLSVAITLLLRDRPWWLVLGGAVLMFLMTLATTWVIVFSIIQAIGFIISELGYAVVGKLGDLIVQGSSNIKRKLRESAVPSWDELGVDAESEVVAAAVEPRDEGVDIFDEPQSVTT